MGQDCTRSHPRVVKKPPDCCETAGVFLLLGVPPIRMELRSSWVRRLSGHPGGPWPVSFSVARGELAGRSFSCPNVPKWTPACRPTRDPGGVLNSLRKTSNGDDCVICAGCAVHVRNPDWGRSVILGTSTIQVFWSVHQPIATRSVTEGPARTNHQPLGSSPRLLHVSQITGRQRVPADLRGVLGKIDPSRSPHIRSEEASPVHE